MSLWCQVNPVLMILMDSSDTWCTLLPTGKQVFCKVIEHFLFNLKHIPREYLFIICCLVLFDVPHGLMNHWVKFSVLWFSYYTNAILESLDSKRKLNITYRYIRLIHSFTYVARCSHCLLFREIGTLHCWYLAGDDSKSSKINWS